MQESQMEEEDEESDDDEDSDDDERMNGMFMIWKHFNTACVGSNDCKQLYMYMQNFFLQNATKLFLTLPFRSGVWSQMCCGLPWVHWETTSVEPYATGYLISMGPYLHKMRGKFPSFPMGQSVTVGSTDFTHDAFLSILHDWSLIKLFSVWWCRWQWQCHWQCHRRAGALRQPPASPGCG